MRSPVFARSAAAALAAAAALLLASCMAAPAQQPASEVRDTASPAPSASAPATPPAGYGPAPVPLPPGAPVPTFTGPYASQFDQAYRSSQSDLQRTVLADGRITDAELVAMQDEYRKCMVGAGILQVNFDVGGSMLVKPPDDWAEDQVHDVVFGCAPTTLNSDLELLYDRMRRSPTTPDTVAVTVECLTRTGLAPAGYTREDWERDSPDAYPFDINDPRFAQCTTDPANGG
ncbi:MAG: hypothetical protein Q4F65_13745 [Propionibacteriaceae bacterium]|nr:hypothetical protein [Propionibacteriaceae bacterium]